MYSIDDFAKDKKTVWTEVRNYQARNFMRDQMHPGDRFLFYHSSSEPSGAAGVGEILKTGVADPTALDRKSEYYDPKAMAANNPWITVEVGFVRKFSRVIALAEIKTNPKLQGIMVAQKGSRLSIQPVSKAHFDEIRRMAGDK